MQEIFIQLRKREDDEYFKRLFLLLPCLAACMRAYRIQTLLCVSGVWLMETGSGSSALQRSYSKLLVREMNAYQWEKGHMSFITDSVRISNRLDLLFQKGRESALFERDKN